MSNLDGKTVLVTGASGLLGSHIALELAKAHCKLILMSRSKEKAALLLNHFDSYLTANKTQRENPRLLLQDIRSPMQIDENVHCIIHAAAPVGPTVFENNPAEVISANVGGTLNLLEFAVKCKCEKFIFASTHEVYGNVEGEQFENSPLITANSMNPRACYALAKQTAENALACYHKQYGLQTVSMRFSRLYGKNMNLESGLFICDFIKDALNGRSIKINGNANLIRPLTHIKDATSAITTALEKGEGGEAYNVQSMELTTIYEIAKIIAKQSKKKLAQEMNGIELAKPETLNFPKSGHWLNCNKLKNLGWEAKISVESGLNKTLDSIFDKLEKTY